VAACGGAAAIGRLVGESRPMQRFRVGLLAAADTPSTVLLCGETGTGKGLAARVLHDASSRCAEPFVHVDCASLSSSLIEAELFGHERGAFTGAGERRIGRFESAGSGTLFLDEVGELGPSLQAKLLRVLQDRQFERLGGSRTLRMSARIVAATNRDLAAEVRRRRFRADLYFRLKVVHLDAPSLRDRAADLPLLVDALLTDLCRKLDRARPDIAPSFWASVARHPWPGNVRELSNLVERLLVAGADPLCGEGLTCGWEAAGEQLGLEFGGGGRRDERERVAAALADAGGNVARAARRLKLPRSTLRYRIAKYRLEGPGDAGI
jgi:transcriptional regulator with GAF, ATPase, and Fis domain